VVVATGKQQQLMTTCGQFDDRIKRLVPRTNGEVNGHWMCDEGRLSYRAVNAAARLQSAQGARGAELDWDQAVGQVAALLRPAAEAGRAAALFSPRLVSETYYAWRRLFAALGTVHSAAWPLVRGADDELLVRADKGANARGAQWILGPGAQGSREVDVLMVFGDPLEPADTPALEPAAARERVYVGPFAGGAADGATLRLPAAAWSEESGSLVNFAGRVQWTRRCHRPRGAGRPGWRVAADVARAAGVELPAWSSAEDVLRDLARDVPEFHGLDAERLGLLGAPGGAPVAPARG
jgi:NADH-quinone oxidoreductase subunit G